ncbi:MAG: glycosyltransferase [Fibrobacteres bacterium]|nr:glycosyltransferase [Fibrobacterota bacterium]
MPVYEDGLEASDAIRCLRGQHWPGKATVQVLDDSRDPTSREAVEQACQEDAPLPVHLVRRQHRAGFKAGALQEGMCQTSAALFAIFDADFRPPEDFLIRAWRELSNDPGLGFVQGRWAHRNRDENRLTRALSLGIDAHFSVEQEARSLMGAILNFNGTAGLWRREAIEAAGGWQGDTLTEDLDLSYRAALAGWRGLFVPDLCAPAEVPPTFAIWIRQQERWAEGSVQTARKLFPRLLRAPVGTRSKVFGVLHLSHYLIHPAMVVLVLLLPWLPRQSLGLAGWMTILATMAVVPLSHAWVLHKNREFSRWRDIPNQTLLGMAATPYLALAAVRGVFRKNSVFRVTPKGSVARARSGHLRGWIELVWLGVLLMGEAIALSNHRQTAAIVLGWLSLAWASGQVFRRFGGKNLVS